MPCPRSVAPQPAWSSPDQSPHPPTFPNPRTRPARRWFSDAELDASLDLLAARQQDDGGWRISRAVWISVVPAIRIADEGFPVTPIIADDWDGLVNKLRAYKLQEEGRGTVEANIELGLPADLRDYGIGAQILVDLGLGSIRLLTNNPKKIVGLEGYGLRVTDQIPIQHEPNPHNQEYLRTKASKLGHLLHHQGLALDEEMLAAERRLDRERGAGEGERPADG